jgi:DNA-binding LacI/PurR family transcriptional regulator
MLDGAINPLPTAIFCASDDIAAGCLEVLVSHGLRVPEDVSLVGYDDVLTARMTTPALTTVKQPFRRLGNRAVELLMLQISNGIVPTIGTTRNLEDSLSPNYPEDKQGITVAGKESGMAAADTDVPHTEVFDVKLVVRGSVEPPSDLPFTPLRSGSSA